MYQLGRDVILHAKNGQAMFFDQQSGSFVKLLPLPTKLVALALKHGPDQTVQAVARKYGISEEDVRVELSDLLSALQQLNLVVPCDSESRPRWQPRRSLGCLICGMLLRAILVLSRCSRVGQRIPPRISSWTVGALLNWSWLSLRLAGWKATIDLCRGCGRLVRASGDEGSRRKIVEAVHDVIRETAAGKLLVSCECKERAVCAFVMLHSLYGLAPRLVLGNERSFQPHAWTECEGIVVTDAPHNSEVFDRIAEYDHTSEVHNVPQF